MDAMRMDESSVSSRSMLIVALLALVGWVVGAGTLSATDSPWAHDSELTDPDPADWAALGLSVAIAGDVIVAGAYGGEESPGEAHIFTRSPSTGEFEHDQRLTNPETDWNDFFGKAVTIDADRIVIGDPSTSSLYVFRPDSSTGDWEFDQKLTKPGGMEGDPLGATVAIQGDVIVAGVHVFTRNTGTGVWEHDQVLADPTAADNDFLGSSVAVCDGRIVLGAPGDDGGSVNEGAVHVFSLDASTAVWIHDQELTDTDAVLGAQLGESVAIEGDRIVAGAFGQNNTVAVEGAVHVFRLNSITGHWEQEQVLSHPSPEYGDFLGASVAIQGDVMVAGAVGDDDWRGVVHVFARDQSTGDWVHVHKLTDPNAAAEDSLGGSVAMDSGWIVAGAAGDDAAGSRRGAVHVFADVAPPTVSIVSPSDGATYERDSVVVASYVCSDAGSGLLSCTGPVECGVAIDTSTTGAHVFEVAATDIAGIRER